jgi:hypothetical protein
MILSWRGQAEAFHEEEKNGKAPPLDSSLEASFRGWADRGEKGSKGVNDSTLEASFRGWADRGEKGSKGVNGSKSSGKTGAANKGATREELLPPNSIAQRMEAKTEGGDNTYTLNPEP